MDDSTIATFKQAEEPRIALTTTEQELYLIIGKLDEIIKQIAEINQTLKENVK